ncbi:sensor histidine kinase [Paenibacillaceae bacterium]|nr:sensor histidine kinase [Paenibacillaceae bacterium]
MRDKIWRFSIGKRSTIHRKFTIGFVLIFAVSACCLYLYMSHSLQNQTEKTIASDMKKLQMFSYDHIKQYALLNPLLDSNMTEHIDVLLRSLGLSSGHYAAYYTRDGAFWGEARTAGGGMILLEKRESEVLLKSAEQDVAAAANNASTVTIVHVDKKSYVILTFPLYINNQLYGALRLTSDYTDRYVHNAAVLQSLAWFTVFLFILVFLFTFYLSRRMTRPLSALSQALLQFGDGQLAGKLAVNTNDEVEELADSFERMRGKIEEQMATIAAEKRKIVELEQSRRQFFHHVTHELKTPLTTISGYAQIIEQPEFNDPAFLRKAAGKIRLESQRLHRMVVEVIALSRRETSPREEDKAPIMLSEVLKAASEDMQMKAAKYHMRIHCTAEPAVIEGQVNELHKVWVNLLDNAIKYGKEGTAIQLGLSLQSGKAVIRVKNDTAADHSVDGSLVFEPFYRKAAEEIKEEGSAGLGLAICKTIIERHQGTISFEHAAGATVVTIMLPLRT